MCYLLCDVPPCRWIRDLDHLFLTFGKLRLAGGGVGMVDAGMPVTAARLSVDHVAGLLSSILL